MVRHLAVRCPDPRVLSELLKGLSGSLARRPVLKMDHPEKLLLLHPRFGSLADLEPMPRQLVEQLGLQTTVRDVIRDVQDCPSMCDELRAVLPEDTSDALIKALRNPHRVGDIAIVSVPYSLRAHGSAIGRTLLRECRPKVRTVLAHNGNCVGLFKTMDSVLLAGSPDLRTLVQENGFAYQVDLAEIFWCTNRAMERRRIVDSLLPGQVLCDLTAGVGPFAIPAAKKGLRVLANDLNPAATHLLNLNARLNDVKDRVRCYNLCARDFAQLMARRGGWTGTCAVPFDVGVMNLPGSSLELLDAFIGIGKLGPANWPADRLPLLHVYCFARGVGVEAQAAIHSRLKASLGQLPRGTAIRKVRDISTDNRMYCVSFRLPPEVAFAQ